MRLVGAFDENGAGRDPELCDRVQRSPASAPHTRFMKINYTKITAAAFWVLMVCAIGVALGMTSLIGWTVLAGFALLPPLVIARWWKDDPSLSESIHEVLR